MAIDLPTIDTENDSPIEWIKNGERASETLLNRPSKGIADVVNQITEVLNDEVGESIDDLEAGTLPPDYVSRWLGVTSAGTAGQQYGHNGVIWTLQTSLSNLSSVEPSLNVPTTWLPYNDASGAVGGGNDKLFVELDQEMTTDYTITENKNAITASFTVASGVNLTVPASSTLIVIGDE